MSGPCRILGLDAAGKTTILYQLNLRETVKDPSVPTIGSLSNMKTSNSAFLISEGNTN